MSLNSNERKLLHEAIQNYENTGDRVYHFRIQSMDDIYLKVGAISTLKHQQYVCLVSKELFGDTIAPGAQFEFTLTDRALEEFGGKV